MTSIDERKSVDGIAFGLRTYIDMYLQANHASVDAAMEGMDHGAFDYLMKPADLEDLLYKLEDAYRKKTLAEQQSSDSRA